MPKVSSCIAIPVDGASNKWQMVAGGKRRLEKWQQLCQISSARPFPTRKRNQLMRNDGHVTGLKLQSRKFSFSFYSDLSRAAFVSAAYKVHVRMRSLAHVVELVSIGCYILIYLPFD